MAKDKISDYSSTANSNTDIAGINIDEGCAPSGINDAIRTLMAQLKTWQSGGQDVYIHPAGTASAPSITANGDTNTGIFFPAADTIAFAEGGVEAMRLDASGNLGLGVTPSAWSAVVPALQIGSGGTFLAGYGVLAYSAQGTNAHNNGTNWIYKNSATASLYQQSGGVHSWHYAPSGTAGNAITFTQAMTLDASGNLGVGTTSPATRVHAYSGTAMKQLTVDGAGAIKTGINFASSGTTYGQIYFDNNSPYDMSVVQQYTTGSLIFGTNSTERARIDSSGNLLVGTTNSSDIAGVGVKVRQVSSQTQVSSVCSSFLNTYVLYNTAAGAYRFYVSEAGQIYATSTSITAISDQALKENIRDLETGLTEVMALQPRRFDWKNGDATNVAGFIAQEVEQVLPELVQDYVYSKDEEGNDITKKSLKMGDILPTLVKALQEMKAIIDDQAARIAALEAK